VRKLDGAGPWVPTLLGPFLERRTEQVLTRPLRCVVWPHGADAETEAASVNGAGLSSTGPGRGSALRRRRTGEALGSVLGPETALRYRPDGKPETDGGIEVSSSHGAGVTFSVAGVCGRAVACDVQAAPDRSEAEWADLLGAEGLGLARLISAERGEGLAVSATRVWGALECLIKAGRARVGLAAATGPRKDAWVLLRSGNARIATFPTTLRGAAEPVVFTMLTECED
jgi:enediyne polyketide synthase